MVKELGGQSVERQSPEALREELWYKLFNNEFWIKELEENLPLTEADRERLLQSYLDGRGSRDDLNQFIVPKRQKAFFKKLDSYLQHAARVDRPVAQPNVVEAPEETEEEPVPEIEAVRKLEHQVAEVARKFNALSSIASSDVHIPDEEILRSLDLIRDEANAALEGFKPFKTRNKTSAERELDALKKRYEAMRRDFTSVVPPVAEEKAIVPEIREQKSEYDEEMFKGLEKAKRSILRDIEKLHAMLEKEGAEQLFRSTRTAVQKKVIDLESRVEDAREKVSDRIRLEKIWEEVNDQYSALLQARIAKRVARVNTREEAVAETAVEPSPGIEQKEVTPEVAPEIELSPEDELVGDIYGKKQLIRILRLHPDPRRMQFLKGEVMELLHRAEAMKDSVKDPDALAKLKKELTVDYLHLEHEQKPKAPEVPELPEANIEQIEERPAFEEEITEIIPRKKVQRKPRAKKRETIGPEAWSPSAVEKEAAATPIESEYREEKIEPTFAEKAKHAFEYLWTRGESVRSAVTDSELYRTQMKGELSSAEFEGKEVSRAGKATKIAAAVLSGVSSFAGVQVFPDTVRYLSQSRYTKYEREELAEAIRSAQIEKQMDGALTKERDEAMRRIESSRYLTPEKRQEMMDKVQTLLEAYDRKKEAADETFNKETAEILDRAVQSKISLMKVGKELGNTAFALLGVNYLRTPLYTAMSLVERWENVTRETGSPRIKERIRKMTVDGFTEFWGDLRGKRGFMNRVQAVGTLSRGVGMAGVAIESIGDVLSWYEGAAPDGVEHLSRSVDLETHRAPVASEAPDVSASRAPYVESTVPYIEGPRVPEAMESLVAEAVVKKGDGITQRLQSLLFEHPEEFGYKGPDDEVMKKLFATREAIAMARRDGLLKMWLSKEAVGNIALIPVEKADGFHVAFVDVKTDEILDPGIIGKFIEKAPSR
jgi:hypothetical protein